MIYYNITPLPRLPLLLGRRPTLPELVPQPEPAGPPATGPLPCATVRAPRTGRVMEVRTTQPGVQLYTGELLDEPAGRGGVAYGKRAALCLETQHHPNSPHHPHFPSVVLRPGDTFEHETTHLFSVD